ncbi:Ig-like domain-containing protein, partial [Verminephrobacter eiseniae]
MNNDAGGVLAQSAAFTVDNVRPYIVNFDMPSVIPGSGARTTIYVTFSEPVSDDTAGATIFSSAEGGYSRGTPDNGGRTWIYQYWPKAANGTNYIGMYLSTFKDLAGNAGSDDSAQYYVKSMTVDSLKPTVASASIAKSDLRLGEKTTITITFSELVTRSSFTIEDLQVDAGKGTLSNLRVAPSDTTATTTAATTWLVDLEAPATRPATGLDGNQIRINLDGITDVAGNAGSGRGVSLPARYNIDDGLPPTVTIAPAATILRAGETMSVTFTFSEKVTGFGTEDIQYDTSKGTLGALTAVGTDGKVWTATYTPQPGTESANNTIRVNLSGVRDAQDNAGVGTATSGNFSIDTVRPTVNVTISDARLTAGESATITFTFSERVTGFAKNAIDLSQANGTLGDLTPVGTDGTTWTATFTPTARLARTTNNRLTLNLYNVRDAAGNAPAANTYAFNQYTVDTMVFVLSNATVNREQLVLSYSDETMLDGNADRAPTNESFTVLVDGTRIDVSRVTVDAAARTVTLTLASAVTTGQTVTVAYQDTDTSDNKAVQEAGTGDDATSFAARAVTNLTRPPVAPATPEAPDAPDSDRDGLSNNREDQAPGL